MHCANWLIRSTRKKGRALGGCERVRVDLRRVAHGPPGSFVRAVASRASLSPAKGCRVWGARCVLMPLAIRFGTAASCRKYACVVNCTSPEAALFELSVLVLRQL